MDRFDESRSLGVERKLGGNLHPRLHNTERSIANKYPEGKVKSTPIGELKDVKSITRKRLFVTLVKHTPNLFGNLLHFMT